MKTTLTLDDRPERARGRGSAGLEPVRLPHGLARAIVLLPFAIAACGLASALTGHDAWYSVEDGFAENTQVVFLLGGALLAALVVRDTRRTEPLVACLYAA